MIAYTLGEIGARTDRDEDYFNRRSRKKNGNSALIGDLGFNPYSPEAQGLLMAKLKKLPNESKNPGSEYVLYLESLKS